MSRNRWHILRERDRYTLARHVPARFDVEATAHFPPARMDRLAQQIRQDLWRELKHLRGFSPVVSIAAQSKGLTVRAGGRVAGGHIPHATGHTIQALLADPARRSRWMRWARASQEPS
ncbi:MAG: hypothetical protein ACPGVS_09460 [Primorskyibacter sp.]